MPTISYFYGIAIRMYLGDHAPSHFHAFYSGHEATYSIETGDRLDGRLPRTAEGLVREWLSINRSAMIENWKLASSLNLPNRIGGLDAE